MSWSPEQIENARTIVQVGQRLGASRRDITVALIAAMTESGLRNLNYGDRDSVGLFQQRAAWGTFAQRTNPAESARMFFQGGHAGQRGLFDFKNRDQMSPGQAAQAVQVSAFPDRYQTHLADAQGLLGKFGVPGSDKGTLGAIAPQAAMTSTASFDIPAAGSPLTEGVNATTAQASGLGEMGFGESNGTSPLDALTFGMPSYADTTAVDPMAELHMPGLGQHGIVTTTLDPASGEVAAAAAEGWRKAVVRMAHQALGTPYVWGGTNLSSGVDCSGLVQSIYNQLGFKMPRISADQARSGQRVGLKDLQPGDLVGWDNSSRNNGADHIAIYIGNGQIIEAPRPGGHVQVSHLYDTGQAWGVRISK